MTDRVPPPPPTPVRSRGATAPAAPDASRDVGVVIVAAGASTRTGGAELKQFRWVAGKPMLLHSVQAFLARPDVAMVVVVLPARYAGDPPPWLLQCDTDRLLLAPGGRERHESVANGLDDLPPECAVVLVHDAARPGVTPAMIDRVVDAAREGRSVVAALPVVDTLKRADADGRIDGTVDRHGMWRAQTPQGFPRDVIVRAHRAAAAQGVGATDDAALVERLGVPVHLVLGDERAMKVTAEEDFQRAERLLAPGA